MEIYNKYFKDETNGFTGSVESYKVLTKENYLKVFLQTNTDDDGLLYKTIQSLATEILIIKIISVAPEFQGKGYGSKMLSEILKESTCSASILLCDITEEQLPGFKLERFYELQGFKAIESFQDYPIMIYPEKLAQEIIANLKKINKNNIKHKY